MKILYIMSSFNIYGGTPKKTLDLLRYFKERSCIYSYSTAGTEHLDAFRASGAGIYCSSQRSSFVADLKNIIRIIDEERVDIIQTQFFRGELLGFFAKLLRPKIQLIVAFVGPFSPRGIKKHLSHMVYKRSDAFVFISDYVRNEKLSEFPELLEKKSCIIFNGTELRESTDDPLPNIDGFLLLDVAGLVGYKNIDVLVEAMNIIVNKRKIDNINLMVAGDGPERLNLQTKIDSYGLKGKIKLLGYHKNIGGLLNSCDVFVHPAYAEGFGIAVIEAMIAKKPVIVSNAGALPELIDNHKTGLIADAFNPEAWADAIERLYNDRSFSALLAENAVKKAQDYFSVDCFVENYERLYLSLLRSQKVSSK